MTLGTAQSFGFSVLQAISSHSWQRGVTNFYSESIPFSFSTGQEYAQFCLSLLSSLKHDGDKPKILELGAGNGVFAKHFLSQAKQANYMCDYIVTEASKPMVDAFDQLQGLLPFKNVSKSVVDLYDFTLDQPFDVGILNYVFDTFPVYNLELYQGKLFEWKVNVRVKPDASLTFFQHHELVTWEASDIETWLLHLNDSKTHLSLLSRVYDCLDIQWTKQEADLSKIDPRGIVQAWIQTQPKTSQGFFNVSSLWWDVLDQLVAQSSDSMTLLLYDFASPNVDHCNTHNKSFGRFGACTFYNVPFFLLETYASLYGLTWLSSQYDEAENQLGVLTKRIPGSSTNKISSLLNQDEPGKATFQSWANLKLLSSADECKTFINQASNVLSSTQQQDYVWLFTVARTYFDCDMQQQALEVVDQVIDQYEFTALNAIVLKLKILRKLQRFHDAYNLVLATTKRITNYDLLWLEKVFICGEFNDKPGCLIAVEQYLKTALKKPQWHLVDVYKKLNKVLNQ